MIRKEVRIDGETLDLSENSPLALERFNPHLSYESIPDSRAQVPNAPFSLRNQQLLAYAEMPQAGNALRRYLCELLYQGALVYRGLAYVKTANPRTGYALEVSDDLSRFFGIYQDLPLSELDLGTVALPEPLPPMVSVDGMEAVCFPTILNPDYYGTNGPLISYGGRVNPYTGGSYTEDGPLVPMLTIPFVLSRIAARTGVTIDGTFLTHPTWQKLLLTNWRALDDGPTVVVNRHVPAWTIAQFILELRKIPNLRYTFDAAERRLTMDFWEEALTLPPAADWTAKATPGHDKYPEQNRRLQLTYELDTGDGLMKDRPAELADYLTPQEAVLGDMTLGIAKLALRLSTFLVDDATGLPMARQTGVTQEFNQLAVSTAPRLLFWHGVQEDLPRALPWLDGISLYLNGPEGLAATSWRRTEALRLGMFYLKKGFLLNETNLAWLDFSRSIHYQGLNYLVAYVAGELPISKEFTCLLVRV